MKRAAAIAGSALLLVSCTRTVRNSRFTAHPAQAHRTASTGVSDSFGRQVLNAVDAGDGDLRVKGWRKALAADQSNLQARLALANHYRVQGFPDVALDHYRRAHELHPDNADAAILLARSLEQNGQLAESLKLLAGWTAARPQASADVHSWLGILTDSSGEYSAAEPHHRSALRLRSDSASLHNNLGYNLLLQGRYEEAAGEFRRSLELDPQSDIARNNLGIALAGKPEAAASQLRSVSDPATAHNNVAAALIERGEYAQARQELTRALSYDRNHTAALKNLYLVSQLDGGGTAMPDGVAAGPRRGFLHRLGTTLFGKRSGPAPDAAAHNTQTTDTIHQSAPAGAASN